MWDESYELIVVRDGQAALELLDPESPSHLRRQPDLVILDLKMPRIDGLEVLGFIRENAATRDLPVVVLTTSDSPFDMDLAEVLHVDDYLLKGTDAKTICRVVGRNVRRSGGAAAPASGSEPETMLKAIGDFPYGDSLGGRR